MNTYLDEAININDITDKEYLLWRQINNWNEGLISILRHHGFKIGVRSFDGEIVSMGSTTIKFLNGLCLVPIDEISTLNKKIGVHCFNSTHTRLNNQHMFISVVSPKTQLTLEEVVEDNVLASLNTDMDVFSYDVSHWLDVLKKDCSMARLEEFKQCVFSRHLYGSRDRKVICLETVDFKGKYFSSGASLFLVDTASINPIFRYFIEMGFRSTVNDVCFSLYHEKEYDLI